jgi:hypothetical protein
MKESTKKKSGTPTGTAPGLIERATRIDDFNPESLYDRYAVTIQFVENIHGPKPATQDLLERHIRRQTGHDDPLTDELIRQAQEGAPPDPLDLDEKVQRSMGVFGRDERGLYLDVYALKACLRQTGSLLGFWVSKRGAKQIASEGMEIRGEHHPLRLHFNRQEPDGVTQAVVHVSTPQGKVHGIKYNEYLAMPELKFQIWLLHTQPSETRHLGEKELRGILTLAQNNGLGADRSKEMGKFRVTSFERLSP